MLGKGLRGRQRGLNELLGGIKGAGSGDRGALGNGYEKKFLKQGKVGTVLATRVRARINRAHETPFLKKSFRN